MGVCLKHFMSTGNKNVRERAKPSKILAGKNFFHREKGWNKYRRQCKKKRTRKCTKSYFVLQILMSIKTGFCWCLIISEVQRFSHY